jgi:hypothetical protein
MEQRGSRHVVLLGDLVAEQRLEIVLQIKFGYGEIGREVGILVGASDREGVLNLAGVAPVGVAWEYADDRSNDAQPRDRTVDRVVARLCAARARQDAVKLNRLGDFNAARLELRQVAAKIALDAGSDPELGDIVQALRVEEAQFSTPMPEMARKEAFADSSYLLRSRGREGKAKR